MTTNRNSFIKPLAVACSASVLVFSPISSVSAATETAETGDQSEVGTLTLEETPSKSNGKKSDGVSANYTTVGQRTSPAQCDGKSNDPHISTSIQNNQGITAVKATAETYCVRTVERLYVRASVWRKRWFGYQEMGRATSGTKDFTRAIKRPGYWLDCDSNTWRTVGNHWSLENGEKYVAETMKYKVINCP